MTTKHNYVVWRTVILLIVMSLPVACGETGETGSEPSASTSNLDACKILSAANAAEIIGEETDAATLVWERHTDTVSVSQCTITATQSGRNIGLMARRERGSKAPASRAAFIESTRGSDNMGVGAETADALEAGNEIPNLGDLALTYDLISFNLMVWNGDIQFTVMLNDFGNGAEAEAAAVRVAKSVLSQI